MDILEILSFSVIIIAIFILFVWLFKIVFEFFYLENRLFVALVKTILVIGFIILVLLALGYLKFMRGE